MCTHRISWDMIGCVLLVWTEGCVSTLFPEQGLRIRQENQWQEILGASYGRISWKGRVGIVMLLYKCPLEGTDYRRDIQSPSGEPLGTENVGKPLPLASSILELWAHCEWVTARMEATHELNRIDFSSFLFLLPLSAIFKTILTSHHQLFSPSCCHCSVLCSLKSASWQSRQFKIINQIIVYYCCKSSGIIIRIKSNLLAMI